MLKAILISVLSIVSIPAVADEKFEITYTDPVKNIYADSVFAANLKSDQLTDSALTDKLYYHFYKGLVIKAKKADKQAALNEFTYCMRLDSSATNYDIYSASAYQASQIMQSANNYKEAYFFLNLAHSTNPSNLLYLEDLAWFEYSVENYKQSTDYFLKLNKLSPGNPRYIHGLSKTYQQSGLYSKAIKAIDKCIELEGHSLQLLSEKSEIWYAAGYPEKAVAEINAYMEKYPAEKLEAMYMLAQFNILTGKQEKALATLNELNEKYPENSTILLALADFHKRTGNDSLQTRYIFDAIHTRTIPVQAIPEIIRPVLSATIQESDTVTTDAIIDVLNQIYPGQLPILKLSSDTYQALSDTTNWLAMLYRISQMTENETTDIQIIDLELKRNNHAQARRLTAEGYRRYANDNWAYYRLISYGIDEMYDSLLCVADSVIPNLTNNNIRSLVYQIAGDTYSLLGHDSIAMSMYDSCLVYNPKNAGALNNKAYNITKQQNGDLQQAEKLAQKALEIDPENVSILDTYAWILYLRGNYTLSEIYFNKLQRIEQENGIGTSIEGLYHRGMLCMKLNDLKCTSQLFEEAIEKYQAEYAGKNKNMNEPHIIDHIREWLETYKKLMK